MALLSLNKDAKDSDQGYWVGRYVKRACATIAKENPSAINKSRHNHNTSTSSSSRKRPRTQVEFEDQDLSEEDIISLPDRQRHSAGFTATSTSLKSTIRAEKEGANRAAEKGKAQIAERNNTQQSTRSSASQNIKERSLKHGRSVLPASSATAENGSGPQSSRQQCSENSMTRAALAKSSTPERKMVATEPTKRMMRKVLRVMSRKTQTIQERWRPQRREREVYFVGIPTKKEVVEENELLSYRTLSTTTTVKAKFGFKN